MKYLTLSWKKTKPLCVYRNWLLNHSKKLCYQAAIWQRCLEQNAAIQSPVLQVGSGKLSKKVMLSIWQLIECLVNQHPRLFQICLLATMQRNAHYLDVCVWQMGSSALKCADCRTVTTKLMMMIAQVNLKLPTCSACIFQLFGCIAISSQKSL